MTDSFSQRFTIPDCPKYTWYPTLTHPVKRIYKEIYNEVHWDHTYVRSLINDVVNDDCLALIFTYIPVYERPKMAMVCKKWNRVLQYTWSNLKILKFDHWEFDDRPNILYEKFDCYEEWKFMQSLLDKCGRYLTELDLVAYNKGDILPFINRNCRNVVKLRLRFTSNMDYHIDSEFSNLSKLKVLKIIFHDVLPQCTPFDILFNSLKDVANTLNELNLSNWHVCSTAYNFLLPKSFDSLVLQLNALQKLELIGITTSPIVLKHVKDASIEFNYNKLPYIRKAYFDPKFKYLIQIIILYTNLTDELLYHIANNTKNLELLMGRAEVITDAGIEAVTKMKKLKQLHLLGCSKDNVITDSQIKLLKNMEYLCLPSSNKITDNAVTEILENSPELNTLSVMKTGVTCEFLKKAAKISRIRQQRLKLFVDFDLDVFNKYEMSTYLIITNYQEETEEKTFIKFAEEVAIKCIDNF